MNDTPHITIYISGPMSGIPNYNRFAFNNAECKLKEAFGKSCTVINPVKIGDRLEEVFKKASREIGTDAQPKWNDYLKHDIRELTTATHVFVLDGWENSKGACLECDIAKRIGIKVCQTVSEIRQSQQNAAHTGEW